jgi:predicted DNA repair protein MutK
MPDQPRALRIHLTLASAVVPLVATVAYAVLAALGDAPWNVVPALLVATAVYGLVAVWLRLGRVGRSLSRGEEVGACRRV